MEASGLMIRSPTRISQCKGFLAILPISSSEPGLAPRNCIARRSERIRSASFTRESSIFRTVEIASVLTLPCLLAYTPKSSRGVPPARVTSPGVPPPKFSPGVPPTRVTSPGVPPPKSSRGVPSTRATSPGVPPPKSSRGGTPGDVTRAGGTPREDLGGGTPGDVARVGGTPREDLRC